MTRTACPTNVASVVPAAVFATQTLHVEMALFARIVFARPVVIRTLLVPQTWLVLTNNAKILVLLLDSVANVLNAQWSTMVSSVVVRTAIMAIHWLDANSHYSGAIHIVNAMSLVCFAPKLATMIRSALAGRRVLLTNVGLAAIQGLVPQANYVKEELV